MDIPGDILGAVVKNRISKKDCVDQVYFYLLRCFQKTSSSDLIFGGLQKIISGDISTRGLIDSLRT